MTHLTIGIDISKDHLDVCFLPDQNRATFGNDTDGFKALLTLIGGRPVARIVFEPTGPYHRHMEVALARAGLPLAKVNPQQARRFAQAIGQRAKTDRMDAFLLAHMGVTLGLSARIHDPAELADTKDLKELQAARAALLKDRTAAKNRLKTLTLSVLIEQAKARIKTINDDLAVIENALLQHIAQNPELSRKAKILDSIPGIGQATIFALLIDMPELGSMTGKQAASLAGLAPVTRKSGTWTGHAFVHGGRADLR